MLGTKKQMRRENSCISTLHLVGHCRDILIQVCDQRSHTFSQHSIILGDKISLIRSKIEETSCYGSSVIGLVIDPYSMNVDTFELKDICTANDI